MRGRRRANSDGRFSSRRYPQDRGDKAGQPNVCPSPPSCSPYAIPKRGVFEQRRQSFLPLDERHRRHIDAVKVQEIEGEVGQWALSRRARLAGALNAA
jgi:hypothetical protein